MNDIAAAMGEFTLIASPPTIWISSMATIAQPNAMNRKKQTAKPTPFVW